MDPAVDYSAVDSTTCTVVVVPYSCKNLFKLYGDELIHVLLLFLNYFMTGSHPPVYKTSLYSMLAIDVPGVQVQCASQAI